MKTRLENRYQNQPWYIKLYRQTRYKPYAFLCGLKTYFTVTKKDIRINELSRLMHAKLIYQVGILPMQHWYTEKEVFKK